ncbi:uncharacterized protein [Oscarella lobularis]|uniref:uncharacterized protein isoform X2 n=1 Tax=Oscarella lobularis TaxID=121494 RepID=UPI003313B9E5
MFLRPILFFNLITLSVANVQIEWLTGNPNFPYELNINIQDSIEISCKQNDTMGAAIIYLVTEKGFQDCSAEGNNRITDPAPIFGSGINLRSDSECGGCFFYCRGPNSLLDTNQITFNFVQNIEDGTTAYLIDTSTNTSSLPTNSPSMKGGRCNEGLKASFTVKRPRPPQATTPPPAKTATAASDATTSPITQDPSDRITGGPIQSTPKPGGVPQLHVSLGAILLSVAVAYIV